MRVFYVTLPDCRTDQAQLVLIASSSRLVLPDFLPSFELTRSDLVSRKISFVHIQKIGLCHLSERFALVCRDILVDP